MGQENGELIGCWRRGEPGAFEELVRCWQQPVARFLARLCPPDQLQDLCQEVFLRVYLARQRYRETGAFSTWLYRIALNVARDAGRRRRRNLASLNDREPVAAAEIDCERKELASILAHALASLPEPLREVLVLRHYESMSFEAMSRLLQVPASTLKSRFAVALNRLRERLYQLGWSEEDAR
jgi:RNA polymerase sigma-70 factor, ECF subfamily